MAGSKCLVGIGGAVKSVGMLERVPVHLGDGSTNPCGIVYLDFYVLDNNIRYSLIFSHTMLVAVQGMLDVARHRIQYTTPAGCMTAITIPLLQAKHQPIYTKIA